MQLIHAITYAVLIEGSASVLMDNGKAGNSILFIICVTFLFKAEKICKDIFQIKSSVGLTGELSQTGAVGIAFIKQLGPGALQIFKRDKTKTDQDDESDGKQADTRRRKLEQHTSNQQSLELSSGGSGGSGEGSGESSDEEPPVVDEESLGGSENSGDERSLEEEYANAQAVIDARGMDTRLNKMRWTWDSNLGKNGFTNFLKNVGRNTVRNGRKIVIRGVGYTAGTTLKLATFAVGFMAGAATGDMTKALSYGMATSKVGGMVNTMAGKTLKLGTNYFKGKAYKWATEGINNDKAGWMQKMAANRVKKNLTEAGVDVDRLFGGSKGELIRNALAVRGGGMVKGGKAKAALDESSIIIKDAREKGTTRTSSSSSDDD